MRWAGRARGRRREAGLAAWEALGALALVALVIAGGWWLLRRGGGADQRAVTLRRVEAVASALEEFALDNGGVFPTTRQGLSALVVEPMLAPRPVNWRGPYLRAAANLRDGWGRELRYVTPGAGDPPRPYDLWSLGEDNQEGGAGPAADILSWDRTTLLPAEP